MAENFEDYQDLSGTGYQGGGGAGEQVAPEDEFFHSVYIYGKFKLGRKKGEKRKRCIGPACPPPQTLR